MRLILAPFAVLIAATLLGCESTSAQSNSVSTSDKVTFIDIARFDNQLKSSLGAPNPEVTVAFYDKVSPNKTPERLEKWLNAVEKSGGKIEIDPPPGEYVSKDPFSLFGLLGSLWSAIKGNVPIGQDSAYEATKGHDALISLERNAQGEVVISKITFKRKETPEGNRK